MGSAPQSFMLTPALDRPITLVTSGVRTGSGFVQEVVFDTRDKDFTSAMQESPATSFYGPVNWNVSFAIPLYVFHIVNKISH